MLEIHVFDTVQVADSLKEALRIILEAFKKWHQTDEDVPFTLTVKRINNKAPPALEIHVGDTVKAKTAFG
jgi:hypothetical protein